jgi:hypothetical protein
MAAWCSDGSSGCALWVNWREVGRLGEGLAARGQILVRDLVPLATSFGSTPWAWTENLAEGKAPPRSPAVSQIASRPRNAMRCSINAGPVGHPIATSMETIKLLFVYLLSVVGLISCGLRPHVLQGSMPPDLSLTPNSCNAQSLPYV